MSKKTVKSSAVKPEAAQAATLPTQGDVMDTQDQVQTAPIENAADSAASNPNLSIRLVPRDGSEQPKLCNVSKVAATPGMVYVDFGFIEPALINALQRERGSANFPERIDGRLATRVALTIDALQLLQRQINAVVHDLEELALQQLSSLNSVLQNNAEKMPNEATLQ